MQAGGLLRLVLDGAVMGDQFAAERGQRSAAAGAAAHLGGDHGPAEAAVPLVDARPGALVRPAHGPPGGRHQNGRASCRESGCQYVSISSVAGTLKKKQNTTKIT